MAQNTCTTCLFGSFFSICSLGRCANCEGGTPYGNWEYCKLCAKQLKKCHNCGKDLIYNKDELVEIMKKLKKEERQSRPSIADVILAKIESFTSVEEPWKIYSEMLEECERQDKLDLEEIERERDKKFQELMEKRQQERKHKLEHH